MVPEIYFPESLNKVCGPIVFTSKSTGKFVLLDGLENCLSLFAIVNHVDNYFKFQNGNGDTKVIRGQSEKIPFLWNNPMELLNCVPY